MRKLKAIRTGLVVLFAYLVMLPGSASAGLIFSNNHVYAFGGDASAVAIFVEVFDNFAGDFGKYEWRYTVTNNSYDPNPGTSNGFSGFETALPAGVADLQDLYAPNANWIFDCCSGQPVEWDIRDSVGLGVMPIGDMGVFGFSSLPRLITQSEGWFHTWENDVQTNIVNYGAGNGVEVPDVLSPPTVPAPATLALFGIGLAGLGWSRRKKA